jgi:hypothetical protein
MLNNGVNTMLKVSIDLLFLKRTPSDEIKRLKYDDHRGIGARDI